MKKFLRFQLEQLIARNAVAVEAAIRAENINLIFEIGQEFGFMTFFTKERFFGHIIHYISVDDKGNFVLVEVTKRNKEVYLVEARLIKADKIKYYMSLNY